MRMTPIGSAARWFPVGGAVWDGGVGFLEEVYVTLEVCF